MQVLESMPQIPIHVTEIKKLILKDQISPDTSLNEDQLLNVLTSNATGRNPTFFKAFGHREVFGLKSSIPEGGTTVEIVEPVPVVLEVGGGSASGGGGNFAGGAEIQYRDEGVLYVHLPDGHPVITGSGPSDDEYEGGKTTATSPSLSQRPGSSSSHDQLDPLSMEAEVTIGEVSPNLSAEYMDLMLGDSLEDGKKAGLPQTPPEVMDVTEAAAAVSAAPSRALRVGGPRAAKSRRLSEDAAVFADIITLDDDDNSDEIKWQGRRRVGLRPSSRTATTATNHRHAHQQHGLKQQAKRRKKNTNVAAGISLTSPSAAAARTTCRRPTLNAGEIEIPFRPYPEELAKSPKSMKEVLASIPGFNMRRLKLNSQRPSGKKMSCAQLIQQAREGAINLESPESILSQVNLRTLLNKTTFSRLPPLYQFKLMQLLPQVDLLWDEGRGLRLNASAFNNEFFAKACQEWRERLTRGDFSPEAVQKNRSDYESDRRRLDPWKVRHFEPLWGIKRVYDLNNIIPEVGEGDLLAPHSSKDTAASDENPSQDLAAAAVAAASSGPTKREESVVKSEQQQQHRRSAAASSSNNSATRSSPRPAAGSKRLKAADDNETFAGTNVGNEHQHTLMVSPTKSPRVTVTDTTEEITDLLLLTEPSQAKRRRLDLPDEEKPVLPTVAEEAELFELKIAEVVEPVVQAVTKEEPGAQPVVEEKQVLLALVAVEPVLHCLTEEKAPPTHTDITDPVVEEETLAEEELAQPGFREQETVLLTVTEEKHVLHAVIEEEPLRQVSDEPVVGIVSEEEPVVNKVTNEESALDIVRKEEPVEPAVPIKEQVLREGEDVALPNGGEQDSPSEESPPPADSNSSLLKSNSSECVNLLDPGSGLEADSKLSSVIREIDSVVTATDSVLLTTGEQRAGWPSGLKEETVKEEEEEKKETNQSEWYNSDGSGCDTRTEATGEQGNDKDLDSPDGVNETDEKETLTAQCTVDPVKSKEDEEQIDKNSDVYRYLNIGEDKLEDGEKEDIGTLSPPETSDSGPPSPAALSAYSPKQINSRQSSSEDSIPAPVLTSEEPLCCRSRMDRRPSSLDSTLPPTLSPNCEQMSEMEEEEEEEEEEEVEKVVFASDNIADDETDCTSEAGGEKAEVVSLPAPVREHHQLEVAEDSCSANDAGQERTMAANSDSDDDHDDDNVGDDIDSDSVVDDGCVSAATTSGAVSENPCHTQSSTDEEEEEDNAASEDEKMEEEEKAEIPSSETVLTEEGAALLQLPTTPVPLAELQEEEEAATTTIVAVSSGSSNSEQESVQQTCMTNRPSVSFILFFVSGV